MILGVKIQNRETKSFMTRGGGWSKIGNTWANFKNAKLAIYIHPWRVDKESFIKEYSRELKSDFIIMSDDGNIERMPVALYFIDYLTRKSKNHSEIEELIQSVKQYCKENNIELEG